MPLDYKWYIQASITCVHIKCVWYTHILRHHGLGMCLSFDRHIWCTWRRLTHPSPKCYLNWITHHVCFNIRYPGLYCFVHPGVRDKRRVSEIDLSQPRHETAFCWRHNGPVMSQLTDPIKWPNYPLELIGIYVHINTHNKESLTQRCRRSTNVQMYLILLYISIWFES